MTKRQVEISPSHRLIREYYRSREEMHAQGVEHELALRHSFQDLLGDSARLHGWTLIAELGAKAGGHTVRPDATLRDANSIPRGYWEAKDSRDDLAREIEHKIRRGYLVRTAPAVLWRERSRLQRPHSWGHGLGLHEIVEAARVGVCANSAPELMSRTLSARARRA